MFYCKLGIFDGKFAIMNLKKDVFGQITGKKPWKGKDALHISSGGKSSSNTKSYSFRDMVTRTRTIHQTVWVVP